LFVHRSLYNEFQNPLDAVVAPIRFHRTIYGKPGSRISTNASIRENSSIDKSAHAKTNPPPIRFLLLANVEWNVIRAKGKSYSVASKSNVAAKLQLSAESGDGCNSEGKAGSDPCSNSWVGLGWNRQGRLTRQRSDSFSRQG
jgi:hypothetical protein